MAMFSATAPLVCCMDWFRAIHRQWLRAERINDSSKTSGASPFRVRSAFVLAIMLCSMASIVNFGFAGTSPMTGFFAVCFSVVLPAVVLLSADLVSALVVGVVALFADESVIVGAGVLTVSSAAATPSIESTSDAIRTNLIGGFLFSSDIAHGRTRWRRDEILATIWVRELRRFEFLCSKLPSR